MTRSLVVKLTCGTTDPERANQAFTVAALAVAAGAEVSLWLTGDATWFAVAGRADDLGLALATPVADLRAAVLAGGTLTVCSQCAARREIGQEMVYAGVRIAGSAVFVEECLQPTAQALVY